MAYNENPSYAVTPLANASLANSSISINGTSIALGAWSRADAFAINNGNTGINALKFQFTAGNITSGVVTLFGIKEST